MVAGWIALSMALTGCDAERPFEPTSEGPADTARGTQQFDRASDGRVKIEWTGRGARSLQALIDEAPDGALIELPTGTFSFDESIVIRGGRKLELAGAGSGRKGTGPVTHLVGRAPRPVADAEGNVILRAEAAEGFFNSVGSEVVIRDMVISGFDAAIVVKDDEEERSGTTSVYDLVIQNTGRGILALGSGDLFVKDVDILEPLWHGIS
jgi:hypothetical protein